MTKSSQSVQLQTHSRMLASSPSSVAQEGSSPFARNYSLGLDDLLNLQLIASPENGYPLPQLDVLPIIRGHPVWLSVILAWDEGEVEPSQK